MGKLAFPLLALAPAFLFLLGFLIIILDQIVLLSLGGNFASPTLAHWVALARSPEFSAALWRTVIFTLIGTPLQLVCGLLPALLLCREFRGRGAARSVFVIPLAIPGIVTAVIIWIVTNYPFGHLNDLLVGRYRFFPRLLAAPVNWRGSAGAALGLSLCGKIWHDMPITMLILLAGLQSIHPEQGEAAATLGAGALRRFFLVTLPQLVPAISAVLVLRSIEMWKEFLFPFVLAPRYPLLGTLIETAYHDWNNPYQAAAIALVLIGCIALGTAAIHLAMRWLRHRLVRV